MVINERIEQVSHKTIPLVSNIHLHKVKVIKDWNWIFEESHLILTYRFDRYKLKSDKEDKTFECKFDVVKTNNVNYCILNLSCNIEGDTSLWYKQAADKIVPFLNKYCYQDYPVFTKFMYMLRISPMFQLFEDVYAKWCTALDESITELVEELLLKRDLNDKEYLWVISHVPKMYDACFYTGLSHDESHNVISEERNRVLGNPCVTFGPLNC